jgi:hypothetical protein
MRFVVKFMIAVEQNIKDARFGIVIFGVMPDNQLNGDYPSPRPTNKWYNATEWGSPSKFVNGPTGSGTQSELMLALDHLRYNCTECAAVNSSWSQLEMMYTLTYAGSLTPTWTGLGLGKTEYDTRGDPAVPGRFIVLVTDGIPNNNNCLDVSQVNECAFSLKETAAAVNRTKNGTLLITVGLNLTNGTQNLMVQWASEPKNILALPDTNYSTLDSKIAQLLAVMCPAGKGIECLGVDDTTITLTGQGFLNVSGSDLQCRYYRESEDPRTYRFTQGQHINSTMLICPIPQDNWYPGEWTLEYTQDGRGFNPGAKFKTGTLCRPELLVIWWPFCALALLPLAFCRAKKTAPVTTQKVSRGVARPAPAATEEYEEYEEVEEIVAPPEPVNKWKVAPTAYIGFGRARMSVDWAGVAPESAPHEGVRKKVVKKVVSDHAPVPTAGPAFVPTPAQEEPQETVTQTSRPQTVEEPDWVNSFMDRIAAIFCCCCVKKK